MRVTPLIYQLQIVTQCPKWRRRFTALTVGTVGVRALGVVSRKPPAASTGPIQSAENAWESRKYRRISDLFIFLNCLVYILDVISGSQLKVLGAKHNASIINGEWWRLFTANFLHGGAIHLLMNMWALNNMAYVEMPLGRPLYSFIYLTSGVAGASASFMFSRAPSLGASGAVLGIFAAFWMYFQNNKKYLSNSAKSTQQNLQQVIILNIGLGFFISRVDNWGHLGGFACGLLLAFLFGPRLVEQEGKGKKRGTLNLVNQPRLPLFSKDQAFTKGSQG